MTRCDIRFRLAKIDASYADRSGALARHGYGPDATEVAMVTSFRAHILNRFQV